MRHILAAMALGLLAFPIATADAKRVEFSTATMCAALQPCLPPPQFASGPFLEPPKIIQVTLRQVQTICGGGYVAFLGKEKLAQGPETVQLLKASGEAFSYNIMGCAQLTDTSCIVHLPSDLKAVMPELYRLILAHELGHCRGWVHARY